MADQGRGQIRVFTASSARLQTLGKRMWLADPVHFAALTTTQLNSGSERYVFARLRYQTARATDEIGRARHDPVASLRLCAIESIVGAFE